MSLLTHATVENLLITVRHHPHFGHGGSWAGAADGWPLKSSRWDLLLRKDPIPLQHILNSYGILSPAFTQPKLLCSPTIVFTWLARDATRQDSHTRK